MTEQQLYNNLNAYNAKVPNKYADQWGSLLTFMKDDIGVTLEKSSRMMRNNYNRTIVPESNKEQRVQLKSRNSQKVRQQLKQQVAQRLYQSNQDSVDQSEAFSARTRSTIQTAQMTSRQAVADKKLQQSFVYKSIQKQLESQLSRPPQTSHQTTRRPPQFVQQYAQTVISTRQNTGYTQYGFPSTLMQGRSVKRFGDLDLAIENPILVTPQNTLQHAIKTQRKTLNERQTKKEAPQTQGKSQMDRIADGFRVRDSILQNGNRQKQQTSEPVQQLEPVIEKNEDITRMYSSQQADQLILRNLQQNWLQQRATVVDAQVGKNRKNLEFAKDLFISWDVSGDGMISEGEVIKPLVSLGLAPDHKFARKIWQAMKPNQQEGEEVELSVGEFMKIFKPDKYSDYFMNVIYRELKNRALLTTKKTPNQIKKNALKLSPIRANSMPLNLEAPNFNQIQARNDLGQDLIETGLNSDTTSVSSKQQVSASQGGLEQQTQQIKHIWSRLAYNHNSYLPYAVDLPIKVILQWLCDEGISNDLEKAQSILDVMLGKSLLVLGQVNINEFMMFFQKGMFKAALLKLASEFEKLEKAGVISSCLSLTRKLDTYQRAGMMRGMERTSETHQDVKKKLFALKDIVQPESKTFDEMMDSLNNQKPQDAIYEGLDTSEFRFIENADQDELIQDAKQIEENQNLQKLQKVMKNKLNLVI